MSDGEDPLADLFATYPGLSALEADTAARAEATASPITSGGTDIQILLTERADWVEEVRRERMARQGMSGRVTLTAEEIVASTRPGPFVQAMQAETARTLADVQREVNRAMSNALDASMAIDYTPWYEVPVVGHIWEEDDDAVGDLRLLGPDTEGDLIGQGSWWQRSWWQTPPHLTSDVNSAPTWYRDLPASAPVTFNGIPLQFDATYGAQRSQEAWMTDQVTAAGGMIPMGEATQIPHQMGMAQDPRYQATNADHRYLANQAFARGRQMEGMQAQVEWQPYPAGMESTVPPEAQTPSPTLSERLRAVGRNIERSTYPWWRNRR
jgi:hypothetical protein